MMIRINKNRMRKYFGLIIAFYLFLIILLMIVGINGLTLEEERKLRTDGLIIKKEITIGKRVFTPKEEEGFVKIVDDNIFLIKDVKIETGEVFIESGKESYVAFRDGKYNYENYIQIIGDGSYKKIKINGNEFKVKANEKNPPKFVLDENGKLSTGTKFETAKNEYVLNGYKVNLPEDAVVEYYEDRVLVIVPSGSEIIPSVEEGKVKGILEVKTKEPGFLMTAQGKFQTVNKIPSGVHRAKEMSLFYSYENGKLRTYFKDEIAVFFNERNELDFSFMNTRFGTNNPEMDLIFDINDITGTGILLTKDNIGSISIQGKGPIINIMPGNRLNAGINKDGNNDLAPGIKTLSFQGIDGFAVLERGDPGKISVLKISGNSIYGPDKKSFFMSSNQVYHNPSALIPEVNHGDITIPIKISFVNNQGNNAFKWDVFSTNENGYVFVPPGKLESALEYYKGEKGTLVSNSLTFNQISPRARQIYTELTESEQNQLINTLSKGGIASLEAQLGEIELKRSPLRASVTLPGCSGTIVGYRGDKAYILTADHCVGGVGSRTTIWLNSLEGDKGGKYESGYSEKRYRGKGINAKVVATRSSSDVTLLEIQLTDRVKQRGYIQIPSNPNYAKVGDKVMRIGCPGAGSSYRRTSCSVSSVYTSLGRWNTINVRGQNIGAIGGESGGSLIKGRYIVGTTSTGRGFGGLHPIHDLLKDYNYDFLIARIVLIMQYFVTTV